MGGTVFVGRAVAEAALARGYEVTVFHRGLHGAGVFGDRVPGQKLGELLLVKKVKITQPVTVLDLVVPKEPKKAGIDPYNKLIDRTPEDNVIAVVGSK